MAAGKPVVLAIDGVIREVIDQAHGGIAVPPGNPDALADAILCLADEPEKARRMGLQGREFVEQHFDRESLASKFLDLLVGLIS